MRRERHLLENQHNLPLLLSRISLTASSGVKVLGFGFMTVPPGGARQCHRRSCPAYTIDGDAHWLRINRGALWPKRPGKALVSGVITPHTKKLAGAPNHLDGKVRSIVQLGQ